MADERFSALSTDPRYRFPSRKKAKTAIDSRFKGVFTDPEFQQKARVDRYGRKLDRSDGKKTTAVQKLYRLEDEDEDVKRPRVRFEEVQNRSDEDDASEDDEVESRVKDPAREGGFSESSSDEESISDEDDDEEAELNAETAGQEQIEDVPTGEVTHRLAAVNLDWDNFQAVDIFAVASVFLPVGGRIENVTIYPSEFGRERMEYEDLHGPPKDIFKGLRQKNEDDEDDDDGESEIDEDVSEKEDESDEDMDEDEDEKIKQKLLKDQVEESAEPDPAKLRQYQLERLRYYFAIITCDSKASAKAIYDNIDRSEYSSSANIFDLRFVPDDTSFEDDEPSDECTKIPPGYKPLDFRTDALVSSKVELTWDGDNRRRKEVLRQAFSGKDEDLEDLQAYLGSDDDSEAESVASLSTAKERRAAKAEQNRLKTRELFGLSEQPAKSKSGSKEVVGDMQITFHSGLEPRNGNTSVFENQPLDEESTRERYIRKERERKQKRKDRMKASKSGDVIGEDDDTAAHDKEDDLGFDDPFFTDPSSNAAAEKKAKKAERQKKIATQATDNADAAAKKAELELLMADDQADNLRHFDMRDIEKAEKEKRRKGKNKKKKGKLDDEGMVQDTFQVDAEDPRFKALYESHEFAIDPSNPRFKKTENMKRLLDEGRRKRKVDDGDEGVKRKGRKKR